MSSLLPLFARIAAGHCVLAWLGFRSGDDALPTNEGTEPPAPPSIWTRAVADGRFREALIDDPLRALAAFPDVAVSPDQVRQLDGMDRDERERLITDLVRRAHLVGGQARFGTIGSDGRLGGPDGSGGIAPG